MPDNDMFPVQFLGTFSLANRLELHFVIHNYNGQSSSRSLFEAAHVLFYPRLLRNNAINVSSIEAKPLCGTVNHFKMTKLCADNGTDRLEYLCPEQASVENSQLHEADLLLPVRRSDLRRLCTLS